MPGTSVTNEVKMKVSAQDAASGVFARIGKSLDDLKKQTGSRGPIKDVFEILKGGGAVAGITFGARALKDMATEATRLKEDFNAARISAGEFTEGFIQAVPVFGQIRQAGLAIRELMTGEAAAAKAIADEAERANRAIDARKQMLDVLAKSHKDHLQIVREINQEIALIGLSGPQRALAAAGFGQSNSGLGSRAATDAAIAAVKAASNKRMEALRGDTNAARLAFDAATREVTFARGPDNGVSADTLARLEREERAARANLVAAQAKEDAERDARRKAIEELERTHQRNLTEFARLGNAQRLQAAKDFWTQFKAGYDKYTKEVIDKAREAEMEMREAGWMNVMAGIQGGQATRPDFRRALPSSGAPGPTTATLNQGRFLTGDPGQNAQITEQKKANTKLDQLTRSSSKIDRTLGDMLRELIRQRQSGTSTPASF